MGPPGGPRLCSRAAMVRMYIYCSKCKQTVCHIYATFMIPDDEVKVSVIAVVIIAGGAKTIHQTLDSLGRLVGILSSVAGSYNIAQC